jgi:signal transduction histidine kinase
MERRSQIVIGSDGTVLAASGQLPAGLVDARLEHCPDLPHELRDAGHALLRRLRDSADRVVTAEVSVANGGGSVQLVAIEALAIRRAAVDLRALLAAKLAVLSAQAKATHVTLTVTVAADVPALVRVDSEKIAWAVTTLVGNALRYVGSGAQRPAGGTVSVRATYDAAAAAVAIEVQDDGPGIPPASVARLFRRDGLNVLGSGLALLLMSDLCAAHGGRIEVQSRTDPSSHGTTVRLTLPAA